MSLNQLTQDEMAEIEVEVGASFRATSFINEYEKINLIGSQEYGKPDLPEDRFFN